MDKIVYQNAIKTRWLVFDERNQKEQIEVKYMDHRSTRKVIFHELKNGVEYVTFSYMGMLVSLKWEGVNHIYDLTRVIQ